MSKEVILTGLRSNGEFHLGNYLGAILPMIELQKSKSETSQLNMFIPDLHSFTTPIDHSQLFEQSIKNLTMFAAAGLDVADGNTYIYRQSYISAHSEMTWILDCFTYFGELSRMTQFKEKGAALHEQVSAGLFTYPVLMAADILLYDALWVPVGDDQRQHLELVRDVAIRFNNKFGDIFTIPYEWSKQLEFSNHEEGVRIKSLRNPENKMSKSTEDPNGTILLTDAPEEAAKKIMSATTDSFGEIHYDMKERPGISNLLQILAPLSDSSLDEVRKEWEGKTNYGDFKHSVATAVESFLRGFQSSLAAVDQSTLLSKLESSESAMSATAAKKLYVVQQSVGLRPPAK